MLEEAPDVMRLQSTLLFSNQQDLLPELVVVLIWICIKRSHLFALHEAIFFQIRGDEDFKETFALVVVGDWVVRELDEDINMGRSSRVDVMQATLRHLVECLIQLSLH